MPNQTDLVTIQKYVLLATGIPSTSALRDQLSQLHDQTGDFSQIAPLVDDFMTQQVLQNEKGVSGVLQTIASNGFSLDLTEPEADQLVTDFLAQGIDSWSKLFAFLTAETEIDAELNAILNNRAEAANHFTDLLAERNLDNSYNSTQGTRDTREWLDGIDASNESLVAANSIVQNLINSLSTILSAIGQNDNNRGFVINDISAADGRDLSVSSAGDVNGDGLADLIFGAPRADPNGILSGASFVVFGKTDGTAIELSNVEGGSGGFVINGVSTDDYSGRSVSGAGDVNGDGLDDLIVGAPFDDPNDTINSGASFVVFGKDDAAVVELSNVESGTGGFVINGASFFDNSGRSVSSAGDVNGDGLADLIVGTPGDDPNDYDSGSSFVVFGKSDGTVVELSNVEDGTGGFVINGLSADGQSGYSVSRAGDVNGDGLADLIIGTTGSDSNSFWNNASFVVFGKGDGIPIELSDIEGGNGGFVINQVSTIDRRGGTSVSGAGDVNGDGLDDLIVDALHNNQKDTYSGASFVVFGKGDGAAVELSAVESGKGGFVIKGAETYIIDYSVSNAGDVNGDGLDDLIVGENPPGLGFAAFSRSNENFVVFGKSDSTAVELSDVKDGNGGFVISSGFLYSLRNYGSSVDGAGDVNGDGFADLIVRASDGNQNSSFGISDASFVVFGGQGSSAAIGTSGADTLTGNDSANQLVAGLGDDTLVGNGGADVMRGGAGNDILAVSDLTFASLDGGTGTDVLRFDAPLNLDLRTLADTKLDSIEVIDITNDGGNSTISLNLTDLLNLNEAKTASDTLVIHGNAGDIVNLDNASNGQTGTWANVGSGVYEFAADAIGIIGTVTIDATATVNII